MIPPMGWLLFLLLGTGFVVAQVFKPRDAVALPRSPSTEPLQTRSGEGWSVEENDEVATEGTTFSAEEDQDETSTTSEGVSYTASLTSDDSGATPTVSSGAMLTPDSGGSPPSVSYSPAGWASEHLAPSDAPTLSSAPYSMTAPSAVSPPPQVLAPLLRVGASRWRPRR